MSIWLSCPRPMKKDQANTNVRFNPQRWANGRRGSPGLGGHCFQVLLLWLYPWNQVPVVFFQLSGLSRMPCADSQLLTTWCGLEVEGGAYSARFHPGLSMCPPFHRQKASPRMPLELEKLTTSPSLKLFHCFKILICWHFFFQKIAKIYFSVVELKSKTQ